MYISFSHPLYLLFLFIIPLVIFFHFFGLKNLRGKSLKFANFQAIAKVNGIDLYSKNIYLLFFNILFVALLVLALSGMTLHKEVEASSFSFVIAIDNSQSMFATDISPNRISFAKQVAIDFVNSLPYESNLGVISFSGDSYVEQSLTTNKQEINYAIDTIESSNVGGTDIFEAISNAVDVFDKEKNRAVILLSDGQINIGSVSDAVNYAKFNEVLVHTMGIGSVEGGDAGFGISKLDEDSLKSLAYNTGGNYFNINNENTITNSFNEIVQPTRKLSSIDLSLYLMMVAIVFFVIKQFLLSINKIIW
jgi:Ca-activated chloride channel homolog